MDTDYPLEYTVNFGYYHKDFAAGWSFSYKGKKFGAIVAATSRDELIERTNSDIRAAYNQAKEMYG